MKKLDLKIPKRKILKRPEARNVHKLSSGKVLRNLAENTDPIVTDVQKEEMIIDNRSLFFSKEYINEKREGRKWLI